MIHPKEQALLDLVQSETAKRRKVWVYVEYTDRHDVESRLEYLLHRAGCRVQILRTSVPLARREEWIAKYAPHLDVVISHPRLVETGLDLFDKNGRHNRALALMGRKVTAAQALEGTFSSEGLVAMASEDANVEIALARSLVQRMDEGNARRLWSKVVNARHVNEPLSGGKPDSPESAEADLGFWLDAIRPAVEMSPCRHRRRRPVLATCQSDNCLKPDGESGQPWLF